MMDKNDVRPGEEWRDVEGFEGLYEVSSLGRIKSHWGMRDVKYLKPQQGRNGYHQVNLTSRNGEKRKAKIHRLVCAAFHGPRDSDWHAAHTDGDRLNNCASNLSWKTAAENNADQFRHGTKQIGEDSPNAKLTTEQVLTIRSSRRTKRSLAERYGVCQRTIVQIQNRERWAHV